MIIRLSISMKILDCTLRDGGYINDWNFSNQQTLDIINALEKSNIDTIECGYLNTLKGKQFNSTLFNSLSTVDALLSNFNRNIEKVIMINYGDYDVDLLPQKNIGSIDGIRLAFHKQDIQNVLHTAAKIIDLGYKLYFQPMVTKNYSLSEFRSLIAKANRLNIYAFYIVDSFGSMTLNEFQNYMLEADKHLNNGITLGYHSHNNMQLAFSNAINMCTANLNRDIIVDASIYGVGRGAGNLNTELIADYLNTSADKNYEILPLLEVIDEFLNSLIKEKPWGFSPAQYLSASFDCHPNYASYLINKNTNHIVGVRKVLEKLPENKKSSYDKEFIEQLYIEYLMEVKTAIKGDWNINKKKVLLIASGESVKENYNLIKTKIDSHDYITIALNHQPKFFCDYYFFSNQKRFDEFNNIVPMSKTIITSNIKSNIDLDFVLDFNSLVFVNNNFVSNVTIVCLNYLISKNINRVEIAGLDGYKVDRYNYSYVETSVIYDNKELIEQNKIIQNSLDSLQKEVDILFVTPTIFK